MTLDHEPHPNDALAEAVRPAAHRLVTAINSRNHNVIADLLHSLDRQHLYALVVVLAAHVDVPIVETHRRRDEIDENVVLRILAGDRSLASAATVAERVEVTRQWMTAERSLRDLEKITGWQVNRYIPRVAYPPPHAA